MNEAACDREKFWWKDLDIQGRDNICQMCCANYEKCGGWRKKFKEEANNYDRSNQPRTFLKFQKI